MRDPDLMQRADRAAIALEQAWERWRAMHGLGAEPLPPVSSYVGYSLEEPWGQPRVVFGLRADEAELLASLLEGHDCVGSVYSELSARSDWRLPVSGPVSMPGRGYAGRPLSVPAQAPPLETDLLETALAEEYAAEREPDGAPMADTRDDDADRDAARQAAGVAGSARGPARTGRADRGRRRTAEAGADEADEPVDDSDASWRAADDEPSGSDYPMDAGGASQSPLLAPLPDVPEFRELPGEPEAADMDEPGTGTPRRTARAKVPAQGPGYRGPRYQGYPPRYEPGPSAGPVSAGPVVAADNAASDDDDEPEPVRRQHVAKLSRSARRRTHGG